MQKGREVMDELKFQEKLEQKLKEYEEIVHQKQKEGLLKEKTVKTYLLHPSNFVRWCKGDFNPGEKNRK